MKHSKQNKFLALILIFIAFDVLCDNYIAGSFGGESSIQELFLFIGLLFLQIIFSPIQAGLSDFYGRKISLIVSISFSLFSLIFVYLYGLHLLAYLPVLILINLSKGIFGNTVPIAWAAVGDIGSSEGKNLRFSFALATASYAVAYLALIFLKKFWSDTQTTLMLIISFVFVLFLCIKAFFDLKDAKLHDIRKLKGSFSGFVFNQILAIIKDIRNRSIQMIFLAWILWEISIYIILVYYADFSNYKSSVVEILMMVGYILGTLSIKFLTHIPDGKMIRIGYTISATSLLPYFVISCFVQNIEAVLAACYFFHAVGNALLSPTLFSIVSRNRKEHERGKIYGLVESGDTIAFFISGILIMALKYFKIDIFYLVCISLITVVLSWFPYIRFEKITAMEKS